MIANLTWKDWEARLSEIDQAVSPIAKRPVNLEDLSRRIAAADRNRINEFCLENQGLMSELISAYETGDENDRARIRKFFTDFDSFAWAVSYRMKTDTDSELRNYFIYLSILDQGFDTRDFLLTIRGMVDYAKQKQLDYRRVMREVAAFSSTVDRFGWGTTQEILRNES